MDFDNNLKWYRKKSRNQKRLNSKYKNRIRREVPKETIPATIAPFRLLSSLLKMATIPPKTEIANAIAHAILRNSSWSFLTLIKNEIKKATPTIEAIVCLSRSLMNIEAKAPMTAIIKEIIEISSCTFVIPLCFLVKVKLKATFLFKDQNYSRCLMFMSIAEILK